MVEIKYVRRGHGTATLIRDGGRVLLVARCSELEGTSAAQFQSAYHGVEIEPLEAEGLLALYGEESSLGDYLLYPLWVTEYRAGRFFT